jgi:signal transduction histidine kinase
VRTQLRRQDVARERLNTELLRAERIARLWRWDWDVRTDMVSLSAEGARTFGISIPGDSWVSLELRHANWVHPEDRERVQDALTQALETGVTEVAIDFRLVGDDGKLRHVACMAEVERDASGVPLRVWGTSQDVTARREAEEALRKSERLGRDLLEHLITAQEDERMRIAAEIHDDAIQALSAAALRADSLIEALKDSERAGDAAEVERALRGAVASLRNVVADVRPPLLEQVGLVGAIEDYLAAVTRHWEVRYFLMPRLGSEPAAEVGTVLYRIAVEALVNARKHSGCSEVSVRLEDRDGGAWIAIGDNGRGFEGAPEARDGIEHFGLVSMRERARVAGGWLRLSSEPGVGVTVAAWLPTPKR